MNDRVTRAQIVLANSAIRLLQRWIDDTEAGKQSVTTPAEIAQMLATDLNAVQLGTSWLLRSV